MKRTKIQFYRLLMFCAVVFFALDISAQTTISGRVVDTNGDEIISATVLVKGTQGGTVTDFDGKDRKSVV